MIPQQAMDEVRAGVMGRLRRRRMGKRGAAAVMMIACIALVLPHQTKPVPKIAQGSASPQWQSVDVAPSKSPVSVIPRSASGAKKLEKTSQGASRGPGSPPHMEPSQRPAYIKVFTEDPNVVFLLLTSDEGGI